MSLNGFCYAVGLVALVVGNPLNPPNFAFAAGNSAEVYLLDRQASVLRLTVNSGGVQIQGDLEDFRGETRVINSSPLKLKISGKGDFRTLQIDSNEPILSVALASVLQSVASPIFYLEGEIQKAVRSGDMLFEGTIKQGKKVRRVQFPLKLQKATKDRIIFQGQASAPLSSIVDDLPITLPNVQGGNWTKGTARAEGRFSFRRK